MFHQAHKDEIDELPEVLAEKVALLPDLLRESRANGTNQKYSNGFKRWAKWAQASGLGISDILPAKPLQTALYLLSVIQSARTPSPVVTAFYSIKWFHEINGFNSPTNSTLVINILEAGKRKLSKPVNKKEPVTIEILQSLYNTLYEEENMKSQRIICACLVAYAGFLRSSELLNIRLTDIKIDITHMNIFIESSKTDRYRDGSWLVIARTGTLLCPVANIEKYIKWGKFNHDDFLFCNLSATSKGYKIRESNKPMSYTNLRDLFLKAIKPHVHDVSKYGLHSLRSGGATTAANKGIKDRMFKRHGRWASESAKDGYVKDNLSERLMVSKCLGL